MNSTQASILASKMHQIKSDHTGREYRITISLPLGYAASSDDSWPFNSTPDKWPVVYVLDGNWYFGMVTDMIRPSSWCGSISDAIVVGIGYPEDENPIKAFRHTFTRRDHDLTPVVDETLSKEMEAQHGRPVPNGDAPNFLKFIRDELIPFVEQTYRADVSRRVLVGHSYGGLFAAYSLFEAPELFQTLIIGSPTLAYGDRFTFQQEANYAEASKSLMSNVIIYVGDEEIISFDDTTLTDTLKFAAVLESRRYGGLSVNKRVFLEFNHCEVATPGIHWGLKKALKNN
ncbi:alpha/beta hydrolase [bacterium]|nr:alpha/beta hydrolase [bacterium]